MGELVFGRVVAVVDYIKRSNKKDIKESFTNALHLARSRILCRDVIQSKRLRYNHFLILNTKSMVQRQRLWWWGEAAVHITVREGRIQLIKCTYTADGLLVPTDWKSSSPPRNSVFFISRCDENEDIFKLIISSFLIVSTSSFGNIKYILFYVYSAFRSKWQGGKFTILEFRQTFI